MPQTCEAPPHRVLPVARRLARHPVQLKSLGETTRGSRPGTEVGESLLTSHLQSCVVMRPHEHKFQERKADLTAEGGMIHVEQSCDEYEVVAASHDRGRDEVYEEHVDCEAVQRSRLDPMEVRDPTGVPVSYEKAEDRWVEAAEKAAESVIEQHRKNDLCPCRLSPQMADKTDDVSSTFIEDLKEGERFDHTVEVEVGGRKGGHSFELDHTVTFEVVVVQNVSR